MVSQELTIESRGNLRRQGYRLDTTFGWDTHEVPLYTHKAINDKQPGDVVMKMRIGNLKSMSAAEAQYAASKGARGFFMWPPEECFEHEFTPVRIEARPGGGRVEIRQPNKVMGCKWCREARPNNGLQERGQNDIVEDSSSPSNSPSPATVNCALCNWESSTVSRKGKPLTSSQMENNRRLHMKKHAS